MTTEREGRNPLPADAPNGAVARLIDTMAGMDPEWTFEAWLEEAAEQHLDLVEADLARERLRLEQRLHRLEAVQRRMAEETDTTAGVQRNLFDCFEPVNDAAFSALGRRSSEARAQGAQESKNSIRLTCTSTSFPARPPTTRFSPYVPAPCLAWSTTSAGNTKAWPP